MLYEWSLLMLAFGLYSVLGWCIEVAVTAVRSRSFVNRGALNGPIQPIYGVMVLLTSLLLEPAENSLLVLFVFTTVLCIVAELVTGLILEHVFHLRWWDYSSQKFNIMGLVGLRSSLIKGGAVTLTAKYLQPALMDLLRMLPELLTEVTALVLLILMVMDLQFTMFSLGLLRRSWKNVGRVAAALQETTTSLGSGISKKVAAGLRSHQQKHLKKAFPCLVQIAQSGVEPEPKRAVFAAGMGFYKLFWLFLIGALAGDLVEMVYVRLAGGVWMSRSSLLYGPFSLVWGLGCMLISLVLQSFRNKSDRYVFFGGALLGGVYEYVCSVVTEVLFGKVFWDYSDIPLNLNGRVNLLYCLFWGVVAVFWVKGIYPWLSGMIEKLPIRLGKSLTWVLVIFLAADVLLSTAAMIRLQQRENGQPAQNRIEVFLDEHYPDEYLYHRYQNMFPAA